MNVGITAFTDKGAVAASTSVTHPSVIQSWPPPLLTQRIGFSDSDAARRRRRAFLPLLGECGHLCPGRR